MKIKKYQIAKVNIEKINIIPGMRVKLKRNHFLRVLTGVVVLVNHKYFTVITDDYKSVNCKKEDIEKVLE